MENASKALIMAAEVLIGVIILSIGVALFTIFSNYSHDTAMQIEEAQITEFNNNYLKYEDKDVTVHDIVSIGNLARQNNINYEVEDQTQYNENTAYIQVQVADIKKPIEKMTEEEKSEFIKKNSFKDENASELETKYYICTKILISDVTKNEIYKKFKEKK